MNFNFKVQDVFKKEITKIDHSLLPDDFRGDKRQMRFCVDAVATILDEIGIASAKAQGLQKPITSYEKLRNSDHVVYVLVEDVDIDDERRNVIGMLKMGTKRLYVFDQYGECHETVAMCVLDFYVHESKQRMGCGKKLFEYMLSDLDVAPGKLAIDRPSDKFISFLRKHYQLSRTIPQTNNFVVFDGFFNSLPPISSPRHVHSSSFGSPNRSNLDSSGLNYSSGSITYNGRHTAPKPESTVGKETGVKYRVTGGAPSSLRTGEALNRSLEAARLHCS